MKNQKMRLKKPHAQHPPQAWKGTKPGAPVPRVSGVPTVMQSIVVNSLI